MPKRLLVALACTATAACATASGDYPSLAVRDAERVTGRLQPPEPYVPEPLPAGVLNDLEALLAQASSAHQAYQAKLPAARTRVQAARGTGVGSERWALANVAIAGLESERSQVMVALADIDRLYVAAATEGRAVEPLASAQELVGDMVATETATIDDLLAALR